MTVTHGSLVPASKTNAEATAAVAYATARGLVAMVDFNRRFDADYAELRRIVPARVLEIEKAYAVRRRERVMKSEVRGRRPSAAYQDDSKEHVCWSYRRAFVLDADRIG